VVQVFDVELADMEDASEARSSRNPCHGITSRVLVPEDGMPVVPLPAVFRAGVYDVEVYLAHVAVSCGRGDLAVG
jgi:hypothetical protein